MIESEISSVGDDRGAISRHECKYFVNEAMVPLIRDYIGPFVQPDRYAAFWEGFQYPIASLYLDSRDLELYRQTREGRKNRYKLRIRQYSAEPRSPVFFEIKRRINLVVRKTRIRLNRDQALKLLGERSAGLPELPADPGAREQVGPFLRIAQQLDARPFVHVRYWREAYEAASGEPLRLTFDHDLAYKPACGVEFAMDGEGWHSAELDRVILEIKFTEFFPAWVGELIRTFGLQRQAIPKYVDCVTHGLQGGVLRRDRLMMESAL